MRGTGRCLVRGLVVAVVGWLGLATPPVAQTVGPVVGPVAAPGAAAVDNGPRGPGGALRPAGPDWRAVGRLDMGRAGFCTVTLIAPDRVLTAAHCLVDRVSGRAHPVAELRVGLGLRDDRPMVSRRVRAIQTLTRPGGPGPEGGALAQVLADLAILQLDEPVRPAQISAIAHVAGTGADGRASGFDVADAQVLSVVSFAQGRSREAALQDDCILIQREGTGALVLDCNVDHGASGAPVLDIRPDGPRIVAVISARAEVELAGFPPAVVALAAPLDTGLARRLFQQGPEQGLAQGQGVGPGASGGAGTEVRVRRPNGADEGIGARFLRPAQAPQAGTDPSAAMPPIR